jgi:hypothetical protein
MKGFSDPWAAATRESRDRDAPLREEWLRHHRGADIELAEAWPRRKAGSATAASTSFGSHRLALTRGVMEWTIRAAHRSSYESKPSN